jgi:glycogen operon protein
MQQGIDVYSTHQYDGFRLRRGHAFPFGASVVPGGINFSVYSNHAAACTLVLFEIGADKPFVEIPFLQEFSIGKVFTMVVFDLDFEAIEYGFRMDGPWDPVNGHRFDKSKILLDPYARAITGRDRWLNDPNWGNIFPFRSRIVPDDFDWEGDVPLNIPIEDLVIYEMHVRSFTCHESSGVKHPGTFAGIIEKIPYLKELGINCVELMPIFEFDEWENSRTHPDTGERLVNYWGYSTVGFFAPKAGYAASGALVMQTDEFKNLVKELHRNGIEVILDVVYNHTAEGNENGPTLSLRGIDNKTYYMLTPDGYYWNFSGTGNTLNCNNPVVRNMVLHSLRYWAENYHIDGFRFDLAAILGRDPSGYPLHNPPLLESLAHDPILANCKLIAEAWDAGGLYQVGSFPAYGRWAEWNGRFRDEVRNWLRGEISVGALAQRLQGSLDLYPERGPTASINFVTCHDGFTLNDLVSYNHKHNYANGEDNRDGDDNNLSWNHGVEGPTDDPEIAALRRRQICNALALVMVSRGVPMILMGDEIARTKQGNNNTYCHDNELNWLNWDLVKENAALFRFARNIIAFRRVHPVLRGRNHFRNMDYVGSGYPDISWHGTQAWKVDWSDYSRALAFLLCGRHAKDGLLDDDYVYVAMNTHYDALWFEIPQLPASMQWHVFANTGAQPSDMIYEPGNEPRLDDQQNFLLGSRSVTILVGR